MPLVEPSEIGRVFREESGQVVASLVRLFGDIDTAEEAVQLDDAELTRSLRAA